MTIYRIARWSDTFETAESRRHLTLNWISIPIGFGSTGYQLLLDEFGDDAAAIYGCWVALTQIAATCPARGLLCSSKGHPFKTAHMARLSGFKQADFDRLISWASAEDVGWLEIVDDSSSFGLVLDALETKSPGKTRPQPTPRPAPVIAQPLPGNDTSLPNPTQPNPTLPNLTLPNPTSPNLEPASPAQSGRVGIVDGVVDEGAFSGLDLETVKEEARKLQKQQPAMKPSYIWEAACLAHVLLPGLLGDVAAGLRTNEIRKAKPYIDASFRKAAVERGINLAELRAQIPACPVEDVPISESMKLKLAKGTA